MIGGGGRHAAVSPPMSTYELREMFYEFRQALPGMIRNWSVAALYGFLLPLGVTMSLLAATIYTARSFHRWLFPPTLDELHAEALTALQKSTGATAAVVDGGNNNGGGTTARARQELREAEMLLWRVVEKDPTYVAGIQSLAAYYVYVVQDHRAAFRVLSLDACNVPRNESSFASLRMDAEALRQGSGRMVHAILGRDRYLSLSFAATAAAAAAAASNNSNTASSRTATTRTTASTKKTKVK